MIGALAALRRLPGAMWAGLIGVLALAGGLVGILSTGRKLQRGEDAQDTLDRIERGNDAQKDGRASGAPPDQRLRDNDGKW